LASTGAERERKTIICALAKPYFLRKSP
jgi:hypothetical protein